jgi:hypothetical protein
MSSHEICAGRCGCCNCEAGAVGAAVVGGGAAGAARLWWRTASISRSKSALDKADMVAIGSWVVGAAVEDPSVCTLFETDVAITVAWIGGSLAIAASTSVGAEAVVELPIRPRMWSIAPGARGLPAAVP